MSAIIFWASIALIVYTYFGYPALLAVLTGFRRHPVHKGAAQPELSLIIAAHNEERSIRQKIENTLSLDYPPERREIIIVSDGSTDETNRIISTYQGKGITLIAIPERKGKEHAQQHAIQKAHGTILVFSDVSTLLEKDALLRISSNFADATVGCVSSEDQVISDSGAPGGEGAYVKYEMLLRRLESQVHSIVGLSGSFFAVRKELCQEWSTNLPSDFVMVIQAIKRGYRAICDPTAIGVYKTVRSDKEEFQRKIRTVMRGIAVLMTYPQIINPVRYGFFAIQLISHKLLRWLVPFFMLSAFASNLLLVTQSRLYQAMFIGQLSFYALAVLGLLVRRLNRGLLFKIPVFMTLVNLSIAIAWMRYLSGQRAILWQPSKR